jgi:superfamily I DNA and RNA helicase
MLKRRYGQQQFKISSFYQVGTVFGRNLNLIGAESFDRSRADAELERIVKTIPATQKFNVLIIDEAQDLTDRNFRILFSILKADRKVVLFSDAEQTIFSYDNSGGWDYNEKSLFQDAEVSQLRLEMNYRNAKPIHERISQYEDQKTTVYFDEDTLGNHITDVKTNISKDDIYQTLSQILENNSPKDIVVLSFEKDDISKLSRFKDVKGRNISFTTDVADWENGDKILKTTVQSFKGLEANIVVLFMSNLAQIKDKLKYVAESRAKYELYIVE